MSLGIVTHCCCPSQRWSTMTKHASCPRVPDDPSIHTLSERQAERLSALASVPKAELARLPFAEAIDRVRTLVDPKLLFFRRFGGRVVEAQADGEARPVPFATVEVYDTVQRLLAWSPVGSIFSWIYPFGMQRERLATVTTDQRGRFCVWIPRFDVEHYLRWRLERRCYLEWLRKPTLLDVLHECEGNPQSTLGTLAIDEQVLTHAGRVLGRRAVARLHALALAIEAEAEAALARPAFVHRRRPPMPASVAELLEPENRRRLEVRVGTPQHALAGLDPRRFYGPVLRCHTVLLPQWCTVLDVPDLTFEVAQDVDGDGQPEVIYDGGLFDVRWDAGAIGEIVLEVESSASAAPSFDVPAVGRRHEAGEAHRTAS
jgi:hypothetical protein